MTPSPTNDTDFVNHPGVSCLKSGKWVAKIRHPIRKVCVCVGTYSTPEEAADACTRKKLEYESRSEQEAAASFHTYVTDFDQHAGVMRMESGNWGARIRHNKARLWLGSYNTSNEAADAYNLSKLELNSQKIVCSGKAGAVYSTESGTPKAANKRPLKADVEQSMKLQRPCHAYRAKAGRWRTEIRHPIAKAKKIHLGSFDTAEEAAEAYNNMMLEFDLMFPGHKKRKQSNNSCKDDAFAEGKSDSACISGDCSISTRVHLGSFTEEAEEAYKNKMRVVDLMVCAYRKRKKLKGSCEAAAIVKGKSDSTCVSGCPSVSTRVHLGTFTEEAEEAYNNTMRGFDLMVHAHNKRKQSKGSYEADAIVEGQSDSACVSNEPSVSARVHLGTSTEEADEACNSKMREFDLMLSAHKECKQSKVSCKADAIVEGKSGSTCVSGVQLGTFTEEAEDAYNNEMREFDLMVHAHKKQNQSKGNCEADAIVEDKSDSTCKSDDPSVSTNGSSVINTGGEEETRGNVINVNVESLPMLVIERRGEFELGIIDNYGRLVGEYSRLDDELWIC